LDGIVNALSTLATALTPQTPAVETTPAATNKSEEAETPDLEKSLADLRAELNELKEKSASQTPPVITKSQREEFEDVFKSLDPSERMRVALAAMRGEKIE
jgi:ATPase subunit of ABC transporter with duplicated ATPase domains